MGDAPFSASLSLSNAEAAQWNRYLMLAFQAELERNPEADLMSMFSDSYRRQHRISQYRQLSYAGQINLRTLHELQDALREEPEGHILSMLPKNYNRRITMATGGKALPNAEKDAVGVQDPGFRTRLVLAETATVVFPLSEKRLIRESPTLWENPVRGIVVKCNEDIVAKVIWGNRDYTEYTSMQFLAERAPDVPAPRAHGLVALGPFRVIFMSYMPGTTLAEAWPRLSRDGKQSVQQQLEEIFYRLRSLRQDDGRELGGVCGEGVKEHRVDECALFKNINTATEYSDLQFSARHHGSNAYVGLLRSLLARDDSKGSVFTHGDVRTENVIVKEDLSDGGQCVVTGIIDWEDSGFYPAYYECTALTRTLSVVDEDDWYLYLPPSISPSEFPIRWLADRLWGIHLKTV